MVKPLSLKNNDGSGDEAEGDVVSAGTKILPAMVFLIIISGMLFKYISVGELNNGEANLERAETPEEYRSQLDTLNQTRKESRSLNLLGDILILIGLIGIMGSYFYEIYRKVTQTELKLNYIMESMHLEDKDIGNDSESEEPDVRFRI